MDYNYNRKKKKASRSELKSFMLSLLFFTTETKCLIQASYWKNSLFGVIIPEGEIMADWLHLFRLEVNRLAWR